MNPRRRRTMGWAIAVCMTAIVGFAGPAVAQSDAPKAESASQLFDSAQRLFDNRRHDQAIVLFRRAYETSKSPNAHLMIGHCLVALGKTAEAYEEMSATMREAAARAQNESKYAPTRDSAATQLALLEPKIGKVIILLAGEDASKVTLNGASLGADRLGTPVAVEPGTATIEATRADGKSTRREVTVRAGETQKISLRFNDTPGPPAAATAPPRNETPAGTRGGGVRTAGFAVAGVGVAGMAAFGVAGALVQSKLKTLQAECGAARCTDMKYAGVIDSGKTMALVANAGLAVGIAGIVGGGTMIIFGGPSAVPPAMASVELSPQGAMVRYTGTF